MEQSPVQISGRCLCSSVRFSFPDQLRYSAYCHCSECRRFSGSIFSAMGGIEAKHFDVLSGAECIKRYEKTPESIMCFCDRCGSSLFVEKPTIAMVHVRLGALDQMPSLQPQCHVYVGSKVPFYAIADGLPQFETSPD